MITQDSLPSYSRYVLASLDHLQLVFPDVFVAEIMIVERSELLPIPFFNPSILGLVQQQGVITPLVSLKRALQGIKALVPEKITVVRLSEELEEIAGAGLVVDRVISSVTSDQYLQLSSEVKQSEYLRLEGLLTRLGETLWEPLRWHPLS
ncbi:chemotaxis signal transduction protein [Synechococcus sp. PCC 7502]|uniref:chemotaxis protein CheW n=1 Tax=Synechococcus sp. PCC 7502 TaxID=1173263 RepID=UPI00029FE94C|nr:chemotaxis protein CheW [Synechococcus sp. PCC 7502]AFY73103.1 chemotaxis signal transduction protein [Synechococcus sp. PCC 7502]